MTAEIIAKAFGLAPAQMVELDATRLNADDAHLPDDPDDDVTNHAVFRIFHANPAEI